MKVSELIKILEAARDRCGADTEVLYQPEESDESLPLNVKNVQVGSEFGLADGGLGPAARSFVVLVLREPE